MLLSDTLYYSLVLVFNCSTNPSKAEEVWQAASADETVMQLSIMALVICSKSYQTILAY